MLYLLRLRTTRCLNATRPPIRRRSASDYTSLASRGRSNAPFATGLPCNGVQGRSTSTVGTETRQSAIYSPIQPKMAHDRINASTSKRFRDGQTRYSKRDARKDKGKGKIRVPSDGTPREEHRKQVRYGYKERPATPAVTPQNCAKIGSGTAHTSFTVTTQRSQLKRSHGYIDSPRIHIINGDRLGKNPMGIPRE